MLGTLCLAIAAGLGALRVLPKRRALRIVVAAVAIGGLAADGLMRSMPLAVPPGRAILPAVPDALVLELPNEGAIDTAAMYRSMHHGRPIVNGYSGHIPPHYAILSHALRRWDPSVFTELARGRPLVISVNGSFDHGGHFLRLVEGVPGIQPLAARAEGRCSCFPRSRLRAWPRSATPWPAVVRAAPVDTLEIDLGTPRVVRTIGFALNGGTSSSIGAWPSKDRWTVRPGVRSGKTGRADRHSWPPCSSRSRYRSGSRCRTCRCATCASTPRRGGSSGKSRCMGRGRRRLGFDFPSLTFSHVSLSEPCWPWFPPGRSMSSDPASNPSI